jgi:NifU-like protein involved in Fe-S cluster formation
MFSEIVLEHFRHPHNAGNLAEASATVEVVNPVCGDILRLAVCVEHGRIVAVRFKTQGCVASIAASSILTDLLAGRTLPEARAITPEGISQALGVLPAASFHAAQLGADGVRALLNELMGR